jgi:hypothetical protein
LYVFQSPTNVGVLADGNIFEHEIQVSKVEVFVNYDFGFHDPDYADLAQFFWQQLDWIKPESYLAGNDFLNFVTANQSLFNSVHRGLRESR